MVATVVRSTVGATVVRITVVVMSVEERNVNIDLCEVDTEKGYIDIGTENISFAVLNTTLLLAENSGINIGTENSAAVLFVAMVRGTVVRSIVVRTIVVRIIVVGTTVVRTIVVGITVVRTIVVGTTVVRCTVAVMSAEERNVNIDLCEVDTEKGYIDIGTENIAFAVLDTTLLLAENSGINIGTENSAAVLVVAMVVASLVSLAKEGNVYFGAEERVTTVLRSVLLLCEDLAGNIVTSKSTALSSLRICGVGVVEGEVVFRHEVVDSRSFNEGIRNWSGRNQGERGDDGEDGRDGTHFDFRGGRLLGIIGSYGS